MDGACCYTTIANFAKLCSEDLLVLRAVDFVDEMVFDMAMIVMKAMCLLLVAVQKQVGYRLRFLVHHQLDFDLDSLWLKLQTEKNTRYYVAKIHVILLYFALR